MTSLDQTVSDAATIEPPSGAADVVRPSGPGAAGVEQETTANLLAGLATRLRSAYEAGADLSDLAVACHQPLSTVRRLLADAGVELARLEFAEVEFAGGSVSEPIEARQLRRLRRPTPSRRLRRIHSAGPSDEPSDEPETGLRSGGSPDGSATVAAPLAPNIPQEDRVPLGVLIGGSPGRAQPASSAGPDRTRRVAARLIRANRGTSLVVLPDWRAAIAISVPTEHLLASTGLDLGELVGARLSVVINPDALHDRELAARDWRVEPERGRARTHA